MTNDRANVTIVMKKEIIYGLTIGILAFNLVQRKLSKVEIVNICKLSKVEIVNISIVNISKTQAR